MKRTFFCMSAVLYLAACNQQANRTAPTQVEESSTPEAPAQINTAENDNSEGFKLPTILTTSQYTSLNQDNCVTIEEAAEEAGWIKQQCGMVGGQALYVSEGDLRSFVHAGNEPDNPVTLAPFNHVGKQVEWRLKDGEPFALIYRLIEDTQEQGIPGKSTLFVSKIGKGTKPSCLIAQIAGNAPNANERARKIADSRSEFDCANDMPILQGDQS